MQKSRNAKKQGLVKLEIQNWYLTIDAKIRVNAIFDGAIIGVQLYCLLIGSTLCVGTSKVYTTILLQCDVEHQVK